MMFRCWKGLRALAAQTATGGLEARRLYQVLCISLTANITNMV
ncbi:UNVERIFIED_ORG: hypothetical protein QE446_000863 [Rhizobium sp. SORGH_AS260]|nr:hypothetical protein [Rhizobium sp. SORGH_AS_0285]MDP9753006.1 hypothetical protein [Rhizobium sp. SORGH_AS_0260]MDR6079974.1 hypothetical protein [Agrobacterium sp. SORGH_AS_0440]